MPRLMMILRSVSGGQFTDDSAPGPTRYLIVPDDAAAPTPAHAVGAKAWIKAIMAGFGPPNADDKITGDLVFLVHGYNADIGKVLAMHDLLAAGLGKAGFKGLVVSFDWPSEGVPLAYLEDRTEAKITAMRLVSDGIRLLLGATTDDCKVNVHVVAHSLGAFVVRHAFDHSNDNRATALAWSIAQIALVAGDISQASMSDGHPESAELYRHCLRLTNYYSGFDEVLQISNAKRLGIAPRVGRVGLPDDAPAKAVNLDCSARYAAEDAKGAFDRFDLGLGQSHSWYFHDDAVMRDLAITLGGKIDRNVIPTRTKSPDRPGSFTLTG